MCSALSSPWPSRVWLGSSQVLQPGCLCRATASVTVAGPSHCSKVSRLPWTWRCWSAQWLLRNLSWKCQQVKCPPPSHVPPQSTHRARLLSAGHGSCSVGWPLSCHSLGQDWHGTLSITYLADMRVAESAAAAPSSLRSEVSSNPTALVRDAPMAAATVHGEDMSCCNTGT